LTPLATVYSVAIRLRNGHYDRAGVARRASVPVISVGNLTVGGAGKTPLAIELARRLRGLGRRPAILTRGYHARAGQTPDEVLEFHAAIPGTPVVVDPDRIRGAATAATQHSADCVVLDDGFQHRRLARDLDIVLVDTLNPWGGGRLLPAGRLREPRENLRRASLVVLTRVNQAPPGDVERIAADCARLAPGAPVLRSAAELEACLRRDGAPVSADALRTGGVLGVCGLGNPATFQRLVDDLSPHARLLAYPDHHRYGRRDVSAIQAAAQTCGAAWVVTTRKDWVKLLALWPADGPELVRADLRLRWIVGEDVLTARLRALFGAER
jgi:tetraacyldisaccharide 4'-kinase